MPLLHDFRSVWWPVSAHMAENTPCTTTIVVACMLAQCLHVCASLHYGTMVACCHVLHCGTVIACWCVPGQGPMAGPMHGPGPAGSCPCCHVPACTAHMLHVCNKPTRRNLQVCSLQHAAIAALTKKECQFTQPGTPRRASRRGGGLCGI